MKLNQWFEKTKTSARKFARRLGVDDSNLSKIRHGLQEPKLRIANRIAALTKGEVTTRDLEIKR